VLENDVKVPAPSYFDFPIIVLRNHSHTDNNAPD